MSTLIVDGSALFFAIRELFGDEQLDYDSMVNHIIREIGTDEQFDSKLFYTPCSPSNVGQARFLDHLIKKGWTVRAYPASQVGLIDQRTMSLVPDGPVKDRLMRFDAQIAYVLGDLAGQGESMVVVSDSFNLAEPMVRAKRLAEEVNRESGTAVPMWVAFFSGLMDPRWRKIQEVGIVALDKLVPDAASIHSFPVDNVGS